MCSLVTNTMQAYVCHHTTALAALPDRLLQEIQGLKGGLKTTFCHLSTHPQFATNLNVGLIRKRTDAMAKALCLKIFGCLQQLISLFVTYPRKADGCDRMPSSSAKTAHPA